MAVENPVKFENTHGETESAVVFVHGFTGHGVGTWGALPTTLQNNEGLGKFDCFYWQYPSKLSLKYAVTKWFWENDPGIETLGDGLRTLLNDTIGAAEDAAGKEYDEIKLVAHSMGGLVVQSYVVEEVRRIREGTLSLEDSMLRKVNAIVLFATPSGGLFKARFGKFLKNQIADMSDIGEFVTNLRDEWTAQIDDPPEKDPALAAFRLTAVAGMKDRFVPPESALDPLPFAEHVMVPGNHVELVKPEKVGQQPIDVLVRRITRPTPTSEELQVVYGQTPETVALMQLVQAAAEMGDVEVLTKKASDLLAGDPTRPTVERALGLALGRQAEHDVAAELLRRYLDFTLDGGSQPFADDVQVIQQLAVAESGLGKHAIAVAILKSLPGEASLHPETLGITAGRIKRRWLESGPPRMPALARQALDTYRAGYEAAVDQKDNDQILYNGINTAFMSLALGKPHEELAQAVLEATNEGGNDYWVAATKAEALLLLGQFAEAAKAYNDAFELSMDKRYLSTTGLQAHNIVKLMGSSPGAAIALTPFEANLGGPETLANAEETLENIKDDEESANDTEPGESPDKD